MFPIDFPSKPPLRYAPRQVPRLPTIPQRTHDKPPSPRKRTRPFTEENPSTGMRPPQPLRKERKRDTTIQKIPPKPKQQKTKLTTERSEPAKRTDNYTHDRQQADPDTQNEPTTTGPMSGWILTEDHDPSKWKNMINQRNERIARQEHQEAQLAVFNHHTQHAMPMMQYPTTISTIPYAPYTQATIHGTGSTYQENQVTPLCHPGSFIFPNLQYPHIQELPLNSVHLTPHGLNPELRTSTTPNVLRKDMTAPSLNIPTQKDHEFTPLHPLELRKRAAHLGKLLPQVQEPLRTALQRSPFTPWLPANWFSITTEPLYTASDRDFTPKLYRHDPELLCCLMEADINLLCLDSTTSTADVREFLSCKYGLTEEDASKVLTIPSIEYILQRIAIQRAHQPPGITLHLSSTSRHLTDTPIISHFIPAHLQPRIQRSDFLSKPQQPGIPLHQENPECRDSSPDKADPRPSTTSIPQRIACPSARSTGWTPPMPPSMFIPPKEIQNHSHTAQTSDTQEQESDWQTEQGDATLDAPQHQVKHHPSSHNKSPPSTPQCKSPVTDKDFLSDPQD